MIVGNKEEIKFVMVENETAKGAEMKRLIGPEEGWEDHVMRIVKLAPKGCSPDHKHPWPHINYYIKGEGKLTIEGEEAIVKEGGYSVVPSNKQHQWVNYSENELEFICIVPKIGHQ